ncbi:MAG: DNA polymerase III subunit gamma/tau [Mesorhizobium sp.]|nr:DNA polymerase III subunit gamma/tau [Mesorhizobium sp.]
MSEAGKDPISGAGGAYRVLARKYRPRDFSSLIGQEPMVRTLTNAFASGRIAQAWMLTGVRGVGKTTTARILARALNYRTASIDAPSIALDELGEHCQAIMEGRHVDVIEMDAASHTGIDDIREIIEQVRYAPVSARYKIYIIDEVHMLSTQAFNGLLKTLEEPPPHVKFIFATTEIRKVPITVLSRCQRFDLRRIDAALIKQDLARIGRLEGIEAEDGALAMIARAAEGSMRDAQSIFDQAIAHGGETVTAEAVRSMLGLSDRARIIDLFESLMKGDIQAALAEYRAQYDTGADPAVMLTDLAEFNHLVTRLRFVPEAAGDASLTEDERIRGAAMAETLSVKVLSRTWQMLIKGIPEVQGAARPVSAGEMVLIRIAHAATLPTLDEALRMLEDDGGHSEPGRGPSAARPNGNGNAGGSGASAVGQSRMPTGSGGGNAMRLVESHSATPIATPTPEAQVPDEVPLRSLADIANLATANRDAAFKALVRRHVRLVRIEPGMLEIGLTDDAPRDLAGQIGDKLKAWTGRRWMVTVSREKGGATLAEEESSRRETQMSDARADPAVAAILSRFPGARIIDIRIPDAAGDADMDLTPAPEPGLDAPVDPDDEND